VRAFYLLAVPALALALGCCSRGDLGTQAIEGVTLIDGTPKAPVSPATLIIERGRVIQFGPSNEITVPADAERISGAGLYVFPLDPLVPIQRGADANLILLSVNPALEPDYSKYVTGRMEIGRWTKYPKR